jgi:hypothetical protein
VRGLGSSQSVMSSMFSVETRCHLCFANGFAADKQLLAPTRCADTLTVTVDPVLFTFPFHVLAKLSVSTWTVCFFVFIHVLGQFCVVFCSCFRTVCFCMFMPWNLGVELKNCSCFCTSTCICYCMFCFLCFVRCTTTCI